MLQGNGQFQVLANRQVDKTGDRHINWRLKVKRGQMFKEALIVNVFNTLIL